MAIRFEHQAGAGLIGAYAAGQSAARRRSQKYAMDLWQQERQLQARQQERMEGFKYGAMMEGLRQWRWGAEQAAVQGRFEAGQAGLERRFEAGEAAEWARFEAVQGRLAAGAQQQTDMEIQNALRSGKLVLTRAAQMEMDKIDADLATLMAGDDFDDAAKDEAIGKAQERKQRIRQWGTKQPDDPNALGWVEKEGRYVRPEPGQKATHFGPPGQWPQPTPEHAAELQAEAEQAKKAEKEQTEQAAELRSIQEAEFKGAQARRKPDELGNQITMEKALEEERKERKLAGLPTSDSFAARGGAAGPSPLEQPAARPMAPAQAPTPPQAAPPTPQVTFADIQALEAPTVGPPATAAPRPVSPVDVLPFEQWPTGRATPQEMADKGWVYGVQLDAQRQPTGKPAWHKPPKEQVAVSGQVQKISPDGRWLWNGKQWIPARGA